jgi:hypothetical protein
VFTKLPVQVTYRAATADDVHEITSAGYLSRAGWFSESKHAADDVHEITSAGYLSRAGWFSESKLKMVLWSDRHASLGRVVGGSPSGAKRIGENRGRVQWCGGVEESKFGRLPGVPLPSLNSLMLLRNGKDGRVGTFLSKPITYLWSWMYPQAAYCN